MISFSFAFDPYKQLEAQSRLENFANGMEKAVQNRTQEVLEWGRSRTAREIATNNAVRLSVFYKAIGIDPASMRGTAETITGGLYIDDTHTVQANAFRATQTEEGVVLDLDAAKTATKIYVGAFGPNIPRLGNNIYQRVGKKRFPIRKVADLKAREIPGVTETLKRQGETIKERLRQKIEADKKKLVEEWNTWRSQ